MSHLAPESCRLRTLANCAVLAISLAACAQLPAGSAPIEEPQPVRQAPEHGQEIAQAQQNVLSPWQTIQGGRLISQLDANGFPVPGALQEYTALISPTALAVRGNDLYIADSGARRLYRFDHTLQAMSVVSDIDGYPLAVMPWTRMQVGVNMSLFVLKAENSTILHYTRNGRLLQTLADPQMTSRLAEFAVDDSLGWLVASDKQNNRLLVLHMLGNVSRVIDPVGREFAPLGALTLFGRTLYVLDTVCSCVAVLDEEGHVLERIGQKALIQPRALAVDRNGLIFVADSVDRSLKVFLHGALIASYSAPSLGVTEISALAIDEGSLYIADGQGAKVMAFRINTPAKTKQ